MTVQRMISARRDHREIRNDPLGDPPVIISIFRIAARADVQPSGALDNFEHRPQIAKVIFVALGAHV